MSHRFNAPTTTTATLKTPTQFIVHKLVMHADKQIRTRRTLKALYAALINSLWYHEEMGYMNFSMRTVGYICDLVAHGGQSDPKDEGMGYNSYYCCAPDHLVSPPMYKLLTSLGFERVDPDTTVGYPTLFQETCDKWHQRGGDGFCVHVDASPVEGTEGVWVSKQHGVPLFGPEHDLVRKEVADAEEAMGYSPQSPNYGARVNGSDDEDAVYSPSSPNAALSD